MKSPVPQLSRVVLWELTSSIMIEGQSRPPTSQSMTGVNASEMASPVL